jgi:hypothetical protein
MVTLCWIDIDRLGRNLNHLHRADIKERIVKERIGGDRNESDKEGRYIV